MEKKILSIDLNIVQITTVQHDVEQDWNALLGQRHVNHPPIDHPYKCHENTNHSRVP